MTLTAAQFAWLALAFVDEPTIELDASIVICACGHIADAHLTGLSNTRLRCSECKCRQFLVEKEAT